VWKTCEHNSRARGGAPWRGEPCRVPGSAAAAHG
jgi:hypothetical protein